MQRYMITGALVALAGRATASFGAPGAAAAPKEEPLSFVDQHWGVVTEGDKWPIKWSKGNGEHVALSVMNSTWSHTICGKFE